MSFPRLVTAPHLRGLSALLAGCLLMASTANAQNTNLASAEASTCNIDGDVSITILGITSHYPIACVNPTDQDSVGSDTSSLVGTQTVNLPVLSSVAQVDAPTGESTYRNVTNATVLFAQTGIEEAALAQGIAEVDGIISQLHCDSTTGTGAVRCFSYFAIGALDVGGQPVQLPSGGVPLGYTVPVSNAGLTITLGGVPVLVSNLTGTVVLNDVRHTRSEHQLVIEQIPVAVDLVGSVTVLGLGLVQVHVVARDPIINDIRTTFNNFIEQYTLSELQELLTGEACDPGGTEECPVEEGPPAISEQW